MDRFLKNSIKVFKSLKDDNPKKLNNSQLSDYHRKTHMLYAGNIKRRPVNKDFINAVVSYHNRLVKEMLKRKMKHNTPLEKI